ncbi:hypothetical protein PV10_05618 [Exophiala mesophila]|uniref:Carrier domain-containing protein n=1 Tax=Exophiala mesophila TaxID=212818 RepID=A0A0D1ZAQ0_EXOME|nr:uncharacterized protein PV10_05618 [Exophiala mesophila]KIV91029.1 hypothetical protein PV10_05618 [Exophiala mesophila]
MGEAAGDGFVLNHVGGDVTEILVPDLAFKTYQDQVEYLLLAWSLYLGRGSITNDEFHAYWTVLSGDNGTSSAAPVQKVLPPGFNLDGTMTASHVLKTIQTICRDTNSSSHKASGWENGHILLAADTLSSDIQTQANISFSLEVWISHSTLFVRQLIAPVNVAAEMVKYQIEAYADILLSLLNNYEQPVAQATRVGKLETSRLWRWNAVLPPTIRQCMHDIISEKMSQYPDKQAVVSWEGELSYRQLDDLSFHLALDLVKAGVGIGTVIPLCFEKSIWTVVALLAVMRAGGTFVLTDPQQPEGRLRVIAEEVAAQFVLASPQQKDLAMQIAPPSAKVITVGPELLKVQRDSGAKALEQVPSSAILYIIFTSGSTGKPKGVVISHENFTTGAIPRAEAVGYKSHSRVLDFPSYAFDVSIDCMLCTLAQGGTICVPSDDQRVNDLSGAIQAMQVNMAHMTPSVARLLSIDVMASLEVLGLGGESLSAGDAVNWSKVTRLIIAYGPSECTVGCTINSDVVAGRSYTSIGVGRGGTTWIVDPDDHNVLTPLGGVGELLVEGGLVGVGYLNEPQKTAEVFIEDPTWLLAGCENVPGRHGRLYKTGDLVRYDPDGSGSIVFVGRKDRQVKLRGQRVELAEVEYHLRTRLPPDSAVAAEVITPGNKSREPTLVVFVAEPRSSQPLTLDDATAVQFSKEFLHALTEADKEIATELPRYMVPSAYIPLQVMPLLVSCKVDRKRLQEIGLGMTPQQLAGYRASTAPVKESPTTEVEKLFIQVWKQILLMPNEEIGLKDNFFALGGDSLKAMRLVAMAKSRNISLTVSDVFSHPTLHAMASKAKQGNENQDQEIPPLSLLPGSWPNKVARVEVARFCGLDESSIEDIYPCTPLQEGLLALSAKVSEAYVAQRVVTVRDSLTAERLRAAFTTVSLDCPILRTRIVHIPGRGLFQVVVRQMPTWTSTVGLEQYLQDDRSHSMGLGEPLVRFALVSHKDKPDVSVCLTIHHALYDGWSMPLIIDRVNRTYQGQKTNTPTPFSAFVKYLSQGRQVESESYWKKELGGFSATQFPFLPNPNYQTHADALVEHFVKLTANLSTGITVATSIRAAWALVAAKYADTSDVVFGETLTGRNAPITGITEIEGPLITTVPWRILVDREIKVSDYLQSVRDQGIVRIPHEHLGLQHIRRLSAEARLACDLRTGIVLNLIDTADDRTTGTDEDRPADGFVPVDDMEAAREALKFNSYALMLVFSVTPEGVLVMASFDSNTIDEKQLQVILQDFDATLQQLQHDPEAKLGDLDVTKTSDVQNAAWSQKGLQSVLESRPEVSKARGTWIVDPKNAERCVAIGEVGELLVESTIKLPLPAINSPQWLLQGTTDTVGDEHRLYSTGLDARYRYDGTIEIVESKQQQSSSDVAEASAAPVDLPLGTSDKQQKLLRLWSRILDISEGDISPANTFFELGGDSIGAMKLVSEARTEGLELTVAQVFLHRRLSEMANVATLLKKAQDTTVVTKPFTGLDVPDIDAFLSQVVRPRLADQSWTVDDVLPVRPMQRIAIEGTFRLPRFSARYEIFYLNPGIDRARLLQSCQDLVAQNEILRTVFVGVEGKYFSVVLEKLLAPIAEFEIEGDMSVFSKGLCNLDIQTKMPLGSSFVKFFFVRGEQGNSCLIFRISHAQYDEICLPLMFQQLSALYEGKSMPKSVPFSSFARHVVEDNVPKSISYWRELLNGASMTKLQPDIPLTNTTPVAVHKTFSLSNWDKEITLATLPTAVWSLCLARQVASQDVTFGEVVSGRGIGFPNADLVAGPCWQYIPVRVKFQPEWTGVDLLKHIQNQHIQSSRFEGMALEEIVKYCTDWPESIDWFDSVVHQDVDHVETLNFLSSTSRLETYYPHLEPLREWKIQAFFQGDNLTLEVVTYESYLDFANELLGNLGNALEQLVNEPNTPLFKDLVHTATNGDHIVVGIETKLVLSPSENSPSTPQAANGSPLLQMADGTIDELHSITLEGAQLAKTVALHEHVTADKFSKAILTNGEQA